MSVQEFVGKTLKTARVRLGYLTAMSAIEIIEQIKALPADQRYLVDEFVKTSNQQAKSSDASDASFEALVDNIFDKHATLLQRLAQ